MTATDWVQAGMSVFEGVGTVTAAGVAATAYRADRRSRIEARDDFMRLPDSGYRGTFGTLDEAIQAVKVAMIKADNH